MPKETPKTGIPGLDSYTDNERDYLDIEKRKSGWPEDFKTTPEWPDRRKRMIAKIADKPALDFLKTLENEIMRVWREGPRNSFLSKHKPSFVAQAATQAQDRIKYFILDGSEENVTFAELKERFLEKFEGVVDILMSKRLDLFI